MEEPGDQDGNPAGAAQLTSGDAAVAMSGKGVSTRTRTSPSEAGPPEARRFEQLQALAAASLRITRARTLAAKLEEVTRAAREIVGAHQAFVSMKRKSDDREAVNASSFSDKYPEFRSLDAMMDGSGFHAIAGEQNEPIRLTQAELERDPRWLGVSPEGSRHPPMRGWLAAPLVANDGRILGLIQLSDKIEGDFHAGDQAILVQLAQHASAAIEQKQIEDALREREALLAAFMENSPGSVFIKDAEGRYVVVNRAFLTRIGKRAEDVIGKTDAELWPELADRITAQDRQVTASGESQAFDDSFELDGRSWTLLSQKFPLPGGGIGSVGTDITDIRRTELALRQGQELFERLREASPIGILTADTERIIEANDEFLRMTGYSRGDLEPDGLDWRRMTVPDYLHLDEAGLAQLKEHGRCEPFEKEYFRKDGSRLPILIGAGLLSREPPRWVCFVVDLTALKQAERGLREREERLKLILESAKDYAIITFDADGLITSWSSGAERILGFREEDVVGRHGRLFFTPEDIAAEIPEAEMQMAARSGSAGSERWHMRKDGTRFWASGLMQPLEGGPQHGYVKIFRDLTERKQAERNMRLLIDELNHRVKNTLATVQAIAAQALKGAAAGPDIQEALNSRLMALSRSHHLLTRESWEGAELRDVVKEALEPFIPRAGGESRLQIDGFDIRLRPRQALSLGMALHELGTNAAKYGALSASGGDVRISWHTDHSPAGRRLKLFWSERGGPAVQPPSRKGFGTRLIERGLAHELNGTVRLDFAPGGVTCEIDMPFPVLDDARHIGDPHPAGSIG